MSETPVVVLPEGVSSVTLPATQVGPAPKMSAIQLIEQELKGFIQQREQAVANVHAIEGAIQAAQHLLSKLRSAAAKAEAEVKAGLDAVQKVVTEVEQDVTNVIEFVKKEL